MDVILSSLAGNPLPTSIAVLIAIAAILGYYFFVIPLMEDHKKLKAEFKELQSQKPEARDQALLKKLASLEAAVKQMHSTVEAADNATALNKAIADIDLFISSSSRDASNVHAAVKEMTAELRELRRSVSLSTDSAKIRDDSLERMVTEVSRNMNSVNEKQSQILGALLGMGRIQDRNRGI